jgi:hypothetical protein
VNAPAVRGHSLQARHPALCCGRRLRPYGMGRTIRMSFAGAKARRPGGHERASRRRGVSISPRKGHRGYTIRESLHRYKGSFGWGRWGSGFCVGRRERLERESVWIAKGAEGAEVAECVRGERFGSIRQNSSVCCAILTHVPMHKLVPRPL